MGEVEDLRAKVDRLQTGLTLALSQAEAYRLLLEEALGMLQSAAQARTELEALIGQIEAMKASPRRGK